MSEPNKTEANSQGNRVYKARLFEMIFSQKEELLELYNAINNTDYDNSELLEINTLNNAIYMSMHNDISFIIDSRLALYEHQSTYSPNLPLRYLMYVSDLYSGITKDMNVYGTMAVELPTPKFVIFYNGKEEQPDILAEFLRRNRAEAMSVSIYEYDEEKHMRQVKEEGVAEGRSAGLAEGEDKFAILTDKLLSDSRMEDLQKAVKDKDFRSLLYQEYGI